MNAQAKTRATFEEFEEYDALPETNQIVVLTEGEARFGPAGLHFDDGNSFEPDLFWGSPHNIEPAGRYWHGGRGGK